MAARPKDVDAYIEASPKFAHPILVHLRQLVHRACPGIQEAIKWSFPCFVRRGLVCSMAAFKEHCSFGFWNSEAVLAKAGLKSAGEGMGSFGRITSLSDLPADDVLLDLIREAVRLDEAGVTRRAAKPASRRPAPDTPADLEAALAKNPKAAAAYAKFSPSHRREYVEWLMEAKREETRQRRLAQALEWLAEGKPRHWKYAC